MKNIIFQRYCRPPLLLGLLGWVATNTDPTYAQGIPEPNLIIYGVVRNTTEGNVRLTLGDMTWRWRSALDGSLITATTTLTNLNDQFSYVLRVPCEYPVSGFAASPNTLQLLPTAISYALESVEIDGHPGMATLNDLSLSTANRGTVLQVDLAVSYEFTDSDGDGLPDDWECHYFACNAHPLLDDDGDGMNNLDEYRAGTDPTDPQSLFAFISVVRNADGTVVLQWSSVIDKRYAILRSTEPATGYSVIESGIAATPPTNEYHDTTPADGSPRFYRLVLEP